MASEAKSGDMVLTLGAGNISQLGAQILEEIAQQLPSKSKSKQTV